jgi:hypothetical protein
LQCAMPMMTIRPIVPAMRVTAAPTASRPESNT